MTKNGQSVLNSLWVGDRLGYLEQLCLRSALDTGHRFHLYSYEPDKLHGVPDGVELRDAAEVMPREKLIAYADTGAIALGSNFWRYHLLAKGLGCWCDMDVLFVRPFDFSAEYLFGEEYEGTINSAVLHAPPDSAFTRDLLTLPRPNSRPPWFGPKRTLHYYWRRLREGYLGLEDMPWGTYGPGLVAHLIRKHKLMSFVQPPRVFYPVPWRNARSLYGPAELVEAQIADDTRAVHLWHSQLRELKLQPPPAGSYIAKMCKRFDVEA